MSVCMYCARPKLLPSIYLLHPLSLSPLFSSFLFPYNLPSSSPPLPPSFYLMHCASILPFVHRAALPCYTALFDGLNQTKAQFLPPFLPPSLSFSLPLDPSSFSSSSLPLLLLSSSSPLHLFLLSSSFPPFLCSSSSSVLPC